MDLNTALVSLLAITVVAACAPLVVGLLPWLPVPQVVLFILGGVLIGQEVLDLVDPGSVSLLTELGLGFLFLLAGYEIEPELVRSTATRRATLAWFTALAAAAALVLSLGALGLLAAEVPVMLGLTTTAFGTLLPIVRESGRLHGRFREALLANGAVGELFPVIGIALLLSGRGELLSIAALLLFFAAAALLVWVPRRAVPRRVHSTISTMSAATSQAGLRWVVVLLVGLLALSTVLDLDAVLGAFAAGMVVRLLSGARDHDLEAKLDIIGYGFFVPVFFVVSGVTLDVAALLDRPWLVLILASAILVIRGGSVWLWHPALTPPDRRSLSLLAATGLPLLVALAEVAVRNGLMSSGNAAVLVGAGILTVLTLPRLALGRPTPTAESSAG